MKSIIFVCLGNICRSPLAEGIALDLVKKHHLDIKIASAGTGSWHIGQAPCENSIKVAKEHQIDISALRGMQINKRDFIEYELVVALDQKNFDDLKALGCTNLVKLGSFGYADKDVPDPYFFKGFEGFDKVFEMIENCVHSLFISYKLLKK